MVLTSFPSNARNGTSLQRARGSLSTGRRSGSSRRATQRRCLLQSLGYCTKCRLYQAGISLQSSIFVCPRVSVLFCPSAYRLPCVTHLPRRTLQLWHQPVCQRTPHSSVLAQRNHTVTSHHSPRPLEVCQV